MNGRMNKRLSRLNLVVTKVATRLEEMEVSRSSQSMSSRDCPWLNNFSIRESSTNGKLSRRRSKKKLHLEVLLPKKMAILRN